MKKCPVCGAECFDDMETCFECLHSFACDSQEEKTPIEKMEEAAENSRMLNATSVVFPKNCNEQMFAPNQQVLQCYSKGDQTDRSHVNNFSYTFGGHEESAPDINVQDNKTNNLSSAKPSSAKACNTRNVQNFETYNPRNAESNSVVKCMPKEIVADGRFGDIRCTILDSDLPMNQGDFANNDSNQVDTENNDTNQDESRQSVSHIEDEDGVQTWVLRLSLPADCDGVTVRLERA